MASQETHVKHVCDDCVLGEWDMKFPNLDVWRKPTLLRCPHRQFAIIRGSQACEYFKSRTSSATDEKK